MSATSPFRPLDDDARATACDLLRVSHAALGVLDPDSGAPVVTRIALALTPEGAPVTLISDLAAHAGALKADPRCSLLLGEPGARGDPLTHPRLTLQCRARRIDRSGPEHDRIAAHYLAQRPKATLYAGFADFNHVVFDVQGALLNAGFGKAYRLGAADLTPRRRG